MVFFHVSGSPRFVANPVTWPYGATGFATAHVFGSDGSEFSGGGFLDLDTSDGFVDLFDDD